MLTLRKAEDRGMANFGWLNSKHTFSFGQYYDPNHMGFGPLRVINEDRVQPAEGFPTHGHENMEIISYVLDGALEHKDSVGTGSVIRPGDVQRMTAGTGIRHSEYNHSQEKLVHFLQIWILPEEQGLKPGYEQKAFAAAERQNALMLVASRGGREGSLKLHNDVDLYASLLDETNAVGHTLRAGRKAWAQVARGSINLNGQALNAGDGAAVQDEDELRIVAESKAEVLVFDMA